MCCEQALSRAGRCMSFEATADGYGRGEAFAVVVLAAPGMLASCLALVVGTAVNQDGRSSSLTAPNGPSQQVPFSPAAPPTGESTCRHFSKGFVGR